MSDMSEEQTACGSAEFDEDSDLEQKQTTAYKVPKKVKAEDLLNLDKDDKSLQKYKASLLGIDISDDTNFNTLFEPEHPDQIVIVKSMVLCEDDKEIYTMDLSKDDDDKKCKGKDEVVKIKEGSKICTKIVFCVQKEIVSGLKYEQIITHSVLKTKSKMDIMVGSYAPKRTIEYCCRPEEIPKGFLARGKYTVNSKFSDDDSNVYKQWSWKIIIEK